MPCIGARNKTLSEIVMTSTYYDSKLECLKASSSLNLREQLVRLAYEVSPAAAT